MNKTVACVLSACVVLASGFAVVSTSAQDRTQFPGEPTQGKVWIQNRGNKEAVPVSIQNDAAEPPLRVQVTGVPTVAITAASTVQARVVRQAWEYQVISLRSGQDPVPILNTAGANGWETTGVVASSGTETMIIMKRPK